MSFFLKIEYRFIRMLYAVDSRLVEFQGTFFALKGEKTDGHLFLEEAAKKGAVCAYVEKSYAGNTFGMELFFVESPLGKLQELAMNRLQSANPLVIGVTGSFAKTTTKEGIYAALSHHASCFKTPLNANSQTGIPLAILNGYQDESIAIIEMGIEYQGEMERLASMVQPHIAIITRIDEAHLETLGSIEGIAINKGKIVHSRTQTLFIHDSVQPYLSYFPVNNLQVEIYGQSDELLFEDIVDLCFRLQKREGFPLVRPELPEVALRFEKISHPKGTVILDCYNANPGSMRTFFEEQKKISWQGRRVAIIGEMGGLGEESENIHLKVLSQIESAFDVAFVIGSKARGMYDNLKSRDRKAFFAENLEQLKLLIQNEVIPHDLVLVKGSNVNRLWEVAPCLQHIFST
ncbi:MAG: UDP-N-acetylmuramoyl-tripeptide--D-alanyl-D-alanine ligase [Chlamydiia bacterium]